MTKIDILSSSLVHSTSASTPSSRVDLTPWDLQLLRFDSIQKGLLFKNPNSSHDNQTFIHRLKDSLSKALDYFPPLAGRLISTTNNDDKTTSFFISCNNAGAEFIEALAIDENNVVLSISDVVDPKYIPDEIIYPMFPLNGVTNLDGVSKPLFAVQVTRLADGFFIGCAANHVVVDGTSFWHFLNSWSELCRGMDTISNLPILQRRIPGTRYDGDETVHLPPFDRIKLDDNVTPSPTLLQRFLHYSEQSIGDLKARANSETGSTNTISSFQALTAHLWQVVVRSRHRTRKSADNQVSHGALFYMAIGTRPRFTLPDGYFGNAISGRSIICNEAEILENSLGYVARKINELVSQYNVEAEKKYLEDWAEKPRIFASVGRISGFLVSSSPRFNVYGCDFGWGKPVTVRSGKAQKCDGKMTLFPVAEPGGLDVEVCLAEETMKAM